MDTQAAVLVVDDEPQIRRALRNLFGERGDVVLEAATGREALDLANAHAPDLVVLDIGLPDVSGDEVCRALRAQSAVPILVLSARHSEQEKVRLLDAGADDYLTKPFGPSELLARARALARRSRPSDAAAPEAVRSGDITIDFARRTVTRAGVLVHLTPTEWELLRTLAAHAGRTLTHRQLFDAVWRRDHGNAQQYLRVHVTHLRRKIEVDSSEPTLIVTEPGVGYRFEPPTRVA
ncbi:response regulator receiver (plasmid) [Gemmatirosa kalamazoonensis]|uniref:Response regulator receiver n=1 Tax=Gemmatirosa kalamazoonensis TaxID=861299 RepID=W0RMW0_9BACT|nr:response regulator transcription factor [Gemmatirosa kalamazoonensis]AHG92379.1 response regulator receiver [Gemmatirosa kalamazoonensis]